MLILKQIIKKFINKIILLFFPLIKVKSNYNYKILGDTNDHYFVGYYDKDPVSSSRQYIICHKVESKYSNLVEPPNAKIGLLDIETNKFNDLVSTNAMNWQLGSRAQWLDEDTIIYNDIEEDTQCSIKFDVINKVKLIKYKRPFWDISPNKKFGASLNFSRIKNFRPGYGYIGKNIDNFEEILTVFSLENDNLIYSITLKEILNAVNYAGVVNNDIYLNHIVWSPCNKKLITIFHSQNKIKNTRLVYPVLINLDTKRINFLHKNGYFSHHTFVNKDKILAFLKINDSYRFGIWTVETGWKEIKNSMPEVDGHPTYIESINKVIVDSYQNKFGIMHLYLGSLDQNNQLKKIASIVNHPDYKGPKRCDLHPRVSKKHNFIVCDLPHKNGRKILLLKEKTNKS